MGTRAVPPDDALEGELAALRVRAYGVDADIEDDPRAAARLADLEAWHAAAGRAPLGPFAAPPSAAARADEAPRADDARTDAAAADSDPATRTQPSLGGGSRARGVWTRVRHGRAGAFVAGAAAATAVALAVIGWFALEAPRPDAVLRPTGERPGEQALRLADYARMMLVDESTLRGHESFRGVELWSGSSVLGNRCLLALEPSSDKLLAFGCVPPPAEPSIEIYNVPTRALDDWHEGLPQGTVVRFVLDDDVVTAWVYEGSPQD